MHEKAKPVQFWMWSLFNDCNFTCDYCPIPEPLLKPKSDAFKRFYDISYHDKILDFFCKLHDYSGSWIICLTGGEPLLTPQLEYLSAGLIRIGHKIRYNTNLSIDLDRRDGWFEANPPEAIDVLMVSIHEESLDKLAKVVTRVRTLKARGYPIIVRMVCTRDRLNLVDDLENRFRGCDVTFAPLPEIEFRSADPTVGALPYRYSSEERAFLERHIKGHGEMAMLWGGIDVTNRQCFARTRMFFMHSHSMESLAQISPCNLTSEKVLAHVDDFIGARPRRDITKLFANGPTKCLRPIPRCDCPGLVEHDVVVGVPGRGRYEQMASGYTAASPELQSRWVKENGIEFGVKPGVFQSSLATRARSIFRILSSSTQTGVSRPSSRR